MKKKRIIKLATVTSVAALAGLTLVSCNKKTKTEEVVNYKVSFNSNDPDTTDSATPDTYKDIEVSSNTPLDLSKYAPKYDGYTFEGWFLDSALTNKFENATKLTGDTTFYAKWTKNKVYYSITFSTSQGSAPAAVENVDSIPTTLPTLTADGYTFEGWYTDEACTSKAVAGTNLTANTILYAKWTKVTLYSKLASDEDNILTEDFSTTTTIAEWDNQTNAGIYQKLNQKENTEIVPANNFVEVVDGKAYLRDLNASGNGTHAYVNFGTLDNGTVEGCMDVTIDTLGTGWTLFQLYGIDTAKTSVNEVFGLRNDKTAGLAYRLDGGTTLGTPLNAVTLAAGTTYQIYFNADLQNSKLSVQINGVDYVKDLEIPGLSQLNYIRFVSSDKGSSTLSLDNIAIVHHASSLDAIKTNKTAAINKKYAALDETLYTKNYAAITTAKDNAIAAITAATTADEVTAAVAAFNENLSTCISDAELATYIATKKTEFTTAYASTAYTENATAYNNVVATFDNITGTTKAAVDSVYEAAKASIAQVKSDATILADYITAQVEVVTNYKTTDIAALDATTFARVISNIGTLKTNAATDIAAATTKTQIDEIVTDVKSAIDAQIASTTKTVAEALSESKTELAAYKTNVLSSGATSTISVSSLKTELQTKVNAVALKSASEYSDAAAVATDLQALKDKIDLLDAQYGYYGTLYPVCEECEADFEAGGLAAYKASEQAYITAMLATTTKEAAKELYDEAAVSMVANGEKYQAALKVDLDAREDVIIAANVDKTSACTFNFTAKATLSENAKTEYTNSIFTFKSLSGGKVSAQYDSSKGAYIQLKSSTITFTTSIDNAVFSMTFTGLTAGRTFVISDNTAKTYDQGVEQDVNSTTKVFTHTFAKAGTYTITFSAADHKLSEIKLVEKENKTVTAKVNSISFETTNTVTSGADASSLVTKVTGKADYNNVLSDVTLTGATVSVTKDGTGTAVDTITEAGTYSITVTYGTTATRYNSKTLSLDVTLQAAQTYSVTYNTDYGTKPENLTNVSALPDQLPSLTADGHLFMGWYTDVDCNTPAVAGSTLTGDTILYAKWVNAFKVTFISKLDGTTAPEALTNVTALPNPLPTISTSGYVFEGWYTDENYQFAASAGNAITGDTTLYAKWSLQESTI